MRFNDVLKLINSDFERYFYENDCNKSYLKIFCANPGLWVLIVHRLRRYFQYDYKFPVIKQLLVIMVTIIAHLLKFMTSIELPVTVKIGKACFIPHIGTIIFSYKTELGDNCSILPGVTIGRAGRADNDGVPKFGSQVFISTGAKIIGDIKIADNVTIGANAVVTKDLPENSVVGGVPAKIINYKSSQDFIRYKK